MQAKNLSIHRFVASLPSQTPNAKQWLCLCSALRFFNVLTILYFFALNWYKRSLFSELFSRVPYSGAGRKPAIWFGPSTANTGVWFSTENQIRSSWVLNSAIRANHQICSRVNRTSQKDIVASFFCTDKIIFVSDKA